MKPEGYTALLQQARDSRCGVRLAVQGWAPAVKVRRRLYMARDRARTRGDRSFDSLSVIFAGLEQIFGHPGEVVIIRRDRLPGRDDPDDGLAVYPSDLEFHELPPTIRARGPRRCIPAHSLDPSRCTDPDSCKLIRQCLLEEFDDVREHVAAAGLEVSDIKPPATRELTLEEVGFILERTASLPRTNRRSPS